MKIIVMGAGIIGVSTAWHLAQRGHEVTVVERQSGAAMETSFANAAQISVSYCEPWANPEAPVKLLKWMFRNDAPLLFRPRLDWRQWRWGLQFLSQCTDAAFRRNVEQIVALGAYSHGALKDIVQGTGITYNRLERGIAHYYTDQKSFDAAAQAAALMRGFGVDRRVVSRSELFEIEPAYRSFADHIVGGTYTASDESGDARVFTQELAQRCEAAGVQFIYEHDIVRLEKTGGEISAVQLRQRSTGELLARRADAFVVACGSWSAPLLRTAGVDLSIYPGKGYSATFRLLKPELAPYVSTIDDEVKCAISRLGNTLRVAGTIEVAGYGLSLDTPLAKARCQMLADRIEKVLPGVCDTRNEAQGGQPNFWAGLRPATPTNIPCIGKTKVGKLWVNAGHGTLGWTHGAGSGKAIAELIDGQRPELRFGFLGV
ncbi:MAG: D-amino acid dehydrogenase [Polaromonas sp.]|uniref:D-amino acid dehydrogenase n=1 Tax=Polaromonas sp. TaxID=1869339 RepID=UPI0027310D57|nr:D-amino acid dehydrogenase [Polaromonas sp.]MDP2449283.1 D-amino acid dehydrogenase [Polaromonas sp.]MDP3245522.1 D-amino acid dehydrogenase [Polaromonas sp.]MDP3754700.1 D-amino acid dehydrogenase [Polaromonas sp.]